LFLYRRSSLNSLLELKVAVIFVLFSLRIRENLLFIGFVLLYLYLFLDLFDVLEFTNCVFLNVFLNSLQLLKALVIFLELNLEEIGVSFVHLWSQAICTGRVLKFGLTVIFEIFNNEAHFIFSSLLIVYKSQLSNVVSHYYLVPSGVSR
jgi:hypothetical protein